MKERDFGFKTASEAISKHLFLKFFFDICLPCNSTNLPFFAYAKKSCFFYSQTKIDLATAKSFCSTKFCYRLTQIKEGVFFYLILKTVLLKVHSSNQLLQAADELNHTSQSNFDRRLTGEKATYCAVYVPLGFSCLIFFLDCAHWLLSCRSLDPIRIGLNLLVQRCKCMVMIASSKCC